MKYSHLQQNRDIAFAVALKSSQLQRDSNIMIDQEHIWKTLIETVWKYTVPKHINDILTDIFKLEVEDIVTFLSTNAIVEGSTMKLNDFADLIGGK